MSDTVLLGWKRYLIPIPSPVWRPLVARATRKSAATSAQFMTEDRHRVRDFVVTELPAADGPISPEDIGTALDMPHERVVELLEELEQGMIYLYRAGTDSVVWAYPVTADETPHHYEFDSGESGNAA